MSIGNGAVESVEKREDSCLRRWEQLEKRVMCDKKKVSVRIKEKMYMVVVRCVEKREWR